MKIQKLCLEFSLAPGDCVAATAVARDIKLTYPEIVLDFKTLIPAIFENSPHITPILPNDPEAIRIQLDYAPYLRASFAGERLHFITAFHRDLEHKTGLRVEPLFSKPDLHLSEWEKKNPPISGRYWVVFAGGKSDMTVKHWDYTWYQQVVDRLRTYGVFCVQSGARKKGHLHPPLSGTLNLVGWGYVRHMIWQIAHAEGVICPITAAMHVAAALDKPAVVIAGGHESPWWEHYSSSWDAFGPKAQPPKIEHKYLHTLGTLSCCLVNGCNKRKVIKIDNDNRLCTNLAQRPVGTQILPACMAAVSVDHVIEAVLSHYEQGGPLPPLGEPKRLL